jgi:hypothetical protein
MFGFKEEEEGETPEILGLGLKRFETVGTCKPRGFWEKAESCKNTLFPDL